MCTSCAEPHSIYNKDDLNIFLSDQHVPAVVPSYEGKCMIMLAYGNATLDILRRHIVLPIEVDKGMNISNDRNGAVDIIQEAIAQDKKINLFIGSGTSHLLSGPTGYIHSLQELFYSLNGTVLQPFKGVSSLRSINVSEPMIVRSEKTSGVSVNDILKKLWLEAVNAAISLVVWNTNDSTITNRSQTNNVANETYVPGRSEQGFR